MKRRRFKYLVTVSLLIATLLSCGAVLSVTAENPQTVADFGLPNSERNTTVSGSDLLELLLDADIGSAEAEYINQSGLYKFIYSDAVPASTVTAKLTPDGLLVTLSSWTYTAQNGVAVSWVPCEVTVNSITHPVNGAGECLCEGDWTNTELFDISVTFEAEFSIDSALYNSLANFAYTDAAKKNGELLEYDAQKAKYDASLTAYNQYKQDSSDYALALTQYNIYLSELEEYNLKQEKYEYYLERLAQYTAAKEAYDAYLVKLEQYNAEKELYDAYCLALDEYRTQTMAYNNYLSRVESRVKKLSVMDVIYAKDSNKRHLYGTIRGSTVDTVVKRKDEIVTYTKAPAEAVDLAGECTENLRRILKEYKDLKTDREKYLYYEAHYDEICRNFKDLYETLRSFYNNPVVLAALNSAEKTERYRQFLAQLYVITTALDDSVQRDENWNLEVQEDTYVYVGDLLEDAHIIRDTGTASPKNYSGWPDEVTEPVMPKEVKKPTKPTVVAAPGRQPTEIIKPTAPEPVEQPTEPDPVPAPGDPPTTVKMTAAQKAIVEALRLGQISERSESERDVIIRKTATVSKTTEDLDKYHVRFLNGNTVVLEYDISSGDALVFPTDIPAKAQTDEFTYSFLSWKDEAGLDATEGSVYSDLEFHATFTAQRRSYQVTWDVCGTRYTESLEYGTVPSFSGTTDKPMDERTIYTFNGWDNEPARVTGNATYVAQYSETDRLYEVRWSINGTTVTEQYKYLAQPSFRGIVDKAPDDKYIYLFDGWSPNVLPVTGNVSYEASYSRKPLALNSTETPLSVKTENASYAVAVNERNVDITVLYEQARKKEYGITISLQDCTLTFSSLAVSQFSDLGITKIAASADADGARLLICDKSGRVIQGGAPVILEYNYSDDTGAELVGLIDGQAEPLYIEDGKIVFFMSSGQNIKIIKKYSVSVTPSDLGEIALSESQAEAGDVIQLKQKMVKYGYFVKEIKITAKIGGEPVELDPEALTFKMPEGGATVEVIYERQTFKVTFLSEGKVISEKIYYLGDVVEVPTDPTKEPLGNNIYTFSGWTPEIVAVEGDAEYRAIFTESKLAVEEVMRTHDFQDRSYEWWILLGVVAVLIAGGCVLFVCIRKSKRKKLHGTK